MCWELTRGQVGALQFMLIFSYWHSSGFTVAVRWWGVLFYPILRTPPWYGLPCWPAIIPHTAHHLLNIYTLSENYPRKQSPLLAKYRHVTRDYRVVTWDMTRDRVLVIWSVVILGVTFVIFFISKRKYLRKLSFFLLFYGLQYHGTGCVTHISSCLFKNHLIRALFTYF